MLHTASGSNCAVRVDVKAVGAWPSEAPHTVTLPLDASGASPQYLNGLDTDANRSGPSTECHTATTATKGCPSGGRDHSDVFPGSRNDRDTMGRGGSSVPTGSLALSTAVALLNHLLSLDSEHRAETAEAVSASMVGADAVAQGVRRDEGESGSGAGAARQFRQLTQHVNE